MVITAGTIDAVWYAVVAMVPIATSTVEHHPRPNFGAGAHRSRGPRRDLMQTAQNLFINSHTNLS
jgi:hypothetical protein